MARRVVIGIGNPDRGDDGAGRLAARRLLGRAPPGVEIHEKGGEPAALIACITGADAAWIVDACCSGAPPGALHRFDAAAGPLPRAGLALSSHGLGLAEAIELARALGQLPPRCVVYAIEGAAFGHGQPLSPAVAAGVAEAVDRLLRELGAESAPGGGRVHA